MLVRGHDRATANLQPNIKHPTRMSWRMSASSVTHKPRAPVNCRHRCRIDTWTSDGNRWNQSNEAILDGGCCARDSRLWRTRWMGGQALMRAVLGPLGGMMILYSSGLGRISSAVLRQVLLALLRCKRSVVEVMSGTCFGRPPEPQLDVT